MLLFSFAIFHVNAQDPGPSGEPRSFTVKGDWFIAYQWYEPNQNNNAFKLKRGYLTVENTFNETFSARYTQE